VLAPVAVVAALALSACARDDGTATAQAPAEVAVQNPVLTTPVHRCPEQTQAAGWAGAVAGISCDEAGHLILDRFDRDFGVSGLVGSAAEQIRLSDPGTFESSGFDCGTFPLPDGMGWHILCGRPDQVISFYFTP
jgi:hypothetical protein